MHKLYPEKNQLIFYFSCKKKPFSLKLPYISIILFTFFSANAQSIQSLNVTNSYNQQAIIYDSDSIHHTAWKPILYSDTGTTVSSGSWFNRKFFHEHLLQIKQPGFNINADLIFDEYIGSSKRKNTTPSSNTRGYEVTGNIGNTFYFETASSRPCACGPGRGRSAPAWCRRAATAASACHARRPAWRRP